jgi:hypothetical protein
VKRAAWPTALQSHVEVVARVGVVISIMMEMRQVLQTLCASPQHAPKLLATGPFRCSSGPSEHHEKRLPKRRHFSWHPCYVSPLATYLCVHLDVQATSTCRGSKTATSVLHAPTLLARQRQPLRCTLSASGFFVRPFPTRQETRRGAPPREGFEKPAAVSQPDARGPTVDARLPRAEAQLSHVACNPSRSRASHRYC